MTDQPYIEPSIQDVFDKFALESIVGTGTVATNFVHLKANLTLNELEVLTAHLAQISREQIVKLTKGLDEAMKKKDNLLGLKNRIKEANPNEKDPNFPLNPRED